MKNVLTLAVAVACLSATAFAEELEVGSNVGAFYVKDVTGPAAGTKLCYRCRFRNRPVVSIFARDVDKNVTELISKVDGVVGKNEDKKMAAFVVLMSDQPEAKEGALKTVASTKKIKNTPLTTFDGPAGPPSYKIAKDADVVVMMWVGGTLKVNESVKAADLTEAKITSIVGQTGKILN